jgi:hypothetical protein
LVTCKSKCNILRIAEKQKKKAQKKGRFAKVNAKRNEKVGSKSKVNRRTEERPSQLELIRNK